MQLLMIKVTQLSGFGGAAVVDFDEDAQAFFARLSNPTDSFKESLNRLILDLKSAGFYNSLDVLCVAGDAASTAEAEANSLLNVISTSHSATAEGSPPFVEDEGWTMDSTGPKYIKTGFNPTIGTYKFDDDDNTGAFYIRAVPAANKAIFGYRNSSAKFLSTLFATATKYNATNQAIIGAEIIGAAGPWMISRHSSDHYYFSTNESVRGGSGVSSSSYDPGELYVGCYNDNGTPTDVANGLAIGLWTFGSGIPLADYTDFVDIIEAYFVSRGTDV